MCGACHALSSALIEVLRLMSQDKASAQPSCSELQWCPRDMHSASQPAEADAAQHVSAIPRQLDGQLDG